MYPLRDSFRSGNNLKTMGRFLIVGVLGTVLDMGLFAALRALLPGLPALAANTISYSAGIVNNYTLHRRWTYAQRPNRAVRAQFAQFLLVSLSALALNNALVLLLARPLAAHLPIPAYGEFLAKGCATGVGLCWNYLVNNHWTFRSSGVTRNANDVG